MVPHVKGITFSKAFIALGWKNRSNGTLLTSMHSMQNVDKYIESQDLLIEW